MLWYVVMTSAICVYMTINACYHHRSSFVFIVESSMCERANDQRSVLDCVL